MKKKGCSQDDDLDSLALSSSIQARLKVILEMNMDLVRKVSVIPCMFNSALYHTFVCFFLSYITYILGGGLCVSFFFFHSFVICISSIL